MFQCKLCDRTYQREGSLFKHRKEKHGIRKEKYLECAICNRRFLKKNKLETHIHNFHEVTPRSNRRRIKCSLSWCTELFPSYKTLSLHLRDYHKYPNATKKLNLIFGSMLEFKNWKISMEVKFKASFVKDSKEKPVGENKKRSYYLCHRSYSPRCGEENMKKPIKKYGSNKTGRTCPARIILTSGKNLEVEFFPAHIGHICDVGIKYLSDQDKTKITEKIQEGVPLPEILDQIKNSGLNEENDQRFNLVKLKDLYNLKKAYQRRKRQSKSVNVKSVEHPNDLQKENEVLSCNGEQDKFCEIIACDMDISNLKKDKSESEFVTPSKLKENINTSHSSNSDLLLKKLELIPHLYKGIDLNETVMEEATELANGLISLAKSLSECNANQTAGIVKAEKMSDTIDYLAVHPEFDNINDDPY